MLKIVSLRPVILLMTHEISIPLAYRECCVRRQTYFTFDSFINRSHEYLKKELIGYTMEQMHSVVADVGNYYKFVPYVKKSRIHSEHGHSFKADLIVGFPPLNESYTSQVTIEIPNRVTSECRDGRLFNYLLNEWRFGPGLKDIPQSCVLQFKVAFEFKSLLHGQIANLFFDFLCHQMENAFVSECRRRYGEASIRSYLLYSKRT